jgi:hypothetical protein
MTTATVQSGCNQLWAVQEISLFQDCMRFYVHRRSFSNHLSIQEKKNLLRSITRKFYIRVVVPSDARLPLPNWQCSVMRE